MIQAVQLRRTLSLGAQAIEVLRGVSFEVARGEMVALTGPSGSGKSTLLALLAAIDSPTSGQLILDGSDITHASEGSLARVRNEKIGIVFQSFNLIPTLTALENVEVPLHISTKPGDARRRAADILARVGLADRMHHRPHQLSGGQQQRVAIARALVMSPSVLLADEPTGNLDTQTGQHILALISELRQDFGLTTVVVTHSPDVAACADRVLRLVDGQLMSSVAVKAVAR
jgi:putative ABC transport system ATP-binding protein